jgi:hypothetical protein
MNDDPILHMLAERNPVPEIPPYNEVSETRLRQLLAHIRTGPTSAVPGVGARPSRIRFPVWVATTVGIGLVAVLVTGIVGADQIRTDPPQHIATAPTHQFPRADGSTPIGLIVQRSTIALNGADDYILRGTETQSNSRQQTDVSVSWQDQGSPRNFRNQELNSAGTPDVETINFVENGATVIRTLDYQARRYTEGPLVFRKGPPPAPMSQAAITARDLNTGTDKLLGTSVINGHTELHLSNDEPGMNREIWVDPSTYLPVRMTAHGSWGSYVINYVWIPRTDQKVLEIFQPPVPAGFTKVTNPGGH